jgi:hypothetical protein
VRHASNFNGFTLEIFASLDAIRRSPSPIADACITWWRVRPVRSAAAALIDIKQAPATSYFPPIAEI